MSRRGGWPLLEGRQNSQLSTRASSLCCFPQPPQAASLALCELALEHHTPSQPSSSRPPSAPRPSFLACNEPLFANRLLLSAHSDSAPPHHHDRTTFHPLCCRLSSSSVVATATQPCASSVRRIDLSALSPPAACLMPRTDSAFLDLATLAPL